MFVDDDDVMVMILMMIGRKFSDRIISMLKYQCEKYMTVLHICLFILTIGYIFACTQ